MKKILIVSDSSIVMKSLIAECENKGHEVTFIQDGAEAFSLLIREKFDLLVCSVYLTSLDGVQLISTLKHSNTANSMIPNILLTSGESVQSLFKIENLPDYIIQKDKNTLDIFFESLGKIFDDESKVESVKVLYIDDDKFVQKMIKLWLGKLDYIELTMCGSIAELKEVPQTRFDLIISDNILEDGSFKDVIQHIQGGELKDTPVIIYTGTVAKLNVDEIKTMGNILDILPKPFEMKHFLQKLEMVKKLKNF